MVEQVTRLAYIMSRLGIRAEEVSKRTGIDKTLLSRWKNGQRRLSPASIYSRRITSFLLSLDKAESIISKTLNAYGLDERSGHLQDNFMFWLAEQSLPRASLRNTAPEVDSTEYTASFRVFLGRDGLRSAVITMIDYVMTLPGVHNIVTVALSSFDWLTEDPNFFDLLTDRLNVAFSRGHTLTLITRENFSDNLARFSGLWLSAHLKGYIKSYYCREDDAEVKEEILLAVKDGVCLLLKRDDDVTDGIYTAMYTDSVMVRTAYNNCLESSARAKTQFRYGFFKEPGRFLTDINSEDLLSANSYVCSGLPSFGSIPYRQAHLHVRETLRDTKQHTEQIRALLTTPEQIAPTAKTRHIYCLDSIEKLLLPGRTLDYPLSAIYGKRIHRSRKMALTQLENLRNWLKTCENFELALAPKHIFEKIPMEFICVQNNFCVAWTMDASSSTFVKESNKVDSLFGYAEQLWHSLPKYCKERQRSLRQLNQWLAEKNEQDKSEEDA